MRSIRFILAIGATFSILAALACGGNVQSGTTTSAPTAGFTVAPVTATSGQALTFTDTSTNTPTAWNWTFGDGSASTLQSPTHTYAAAGTFTVTLKATNAGGSGSSNKDVVVGAAGTSATYTMTQTLSDEAQLTTLAFDGLAMLTGNLDAQSFFPPGKVADYTGFQYLRDNTPDGLGHNTSFMTNCANNVLYILNDSQLAQLITLGKVQQANINNYGYQRYVLMQGFRRLMDGHLPSGTTGLSLSAVKQASNALYKVDGQIAFDRALLYANIYKSMAGGTPCNSDSTTTQLAYLDHMKAVGFSGWPTLTTDQLNSIQARTKDLDNGVVVAVMTYAGDIFSWYAGALDADVYFCPERHGTYYGGFYIKDAPAVGHEGYQISTTLTATAGKALSDSTEGYVTAGQATLMSSLVDTQRSNLYTGATNIVGIRTQIATLLRSLLTSTANSADTNAQVLALSGTYGDLDGENNYHYATVFAQVYNSMSADQKANLAALRASILSGAYADGMPYNFTTCTTPFLYSAPITDLTLLMPYISDVVTSPLFF